MSDSEDEIVNNFGSDNSSENESESNNESESDNSSENESESNNESDSENSSDSENNDENDQIDAQHLQANAQNNPAPRGKRQGTNNSSMANKKFIILLKNKYSHTTHKIIPYSLETIENPTICKNSILALNNDILPGDFMIIKKEIERKSKLVNEFTDEQMSDMVKDFYNLFKSILSAEELKE